MPYAAHNVNPTTVIKYIPVEMACVSPVLIMRQALGVKLTVEARAAEAPKRVGVVVVTMVARLNFVIIRATA